MTDEYVATHTTTLKSVTVYTHTFTRLLIFRNESFVNNYVSYLFDQAAD